MKLYFSFLLILACSAPMIAQSGAFTTLMQSYEGEELMMLEGDLSVAEAQADYTASLQVADATKSGYTQYTNPQSWMANALPSLIIKENQDIKQWVAAYGQEFGLTPKEQRVVRKKLKRLVESYRVYWAKAYPSDDIEAPAPPPVLPVPQTH